jgi:hypothetical protein
LLLLLLLLLLLGDVVMAGSTFKYSSSSAFMYGWPAAAAGKTSGRTGSELRLGLGGAESDVGDAACQVLVCYVTSVLHTWELTIGHYWRVAVHQHLDCGEVDGRLDQLESSEYKAERRGTLS